MDNINIQTHKNLTIRTVENSVTKKIIAPIVRFYLKGFHQIESIVSKKIIFQNCAIEHSTLKDLYLITRVKDSDFYDCKFTNCLFIGCIIEDSTFAKCSFDNCSFLFSQRKGTIFTSNIGLSQEDMLFSKDIFKKGYF